MSAPGFQIVDANLRESFRALAAGRESGVIKELAGVSIASVGVAFQMFNSAFLNAPVATPEELEGRLDTLREHFRGEGRLWSLWACEDWIDSKLQRRLSRLCEQRRLRLSAEMPGMWASRLMPARRPLPLLEYRRVQCKATLEDFRTVGALCFHVPPEWFDEVFDERVVEASSQFVAWVAYEKGLPIGTAATVTAHGSVGLYNVATAPSHRRRGVGEAITRFAFGQVEAAERLPLVLQATSQGFRMYRRLGFEAITRIVVYNSW